MKKVSQLDINGYFISSAIADESPLEPGVLLLPAGCVDLAAPAIPSGTTAKYSNGSWVFEPIPADPQPQDPLPQPPNHFTSLEYLDLFTESEQLTVVSATMASPQVKLWYDKMLAAGFITSADPRTEGGLAALVGAGLLTEARKVEILAAMA